MVIGVLDVELIRHHPCNCKLLAGSHLRNFIHYFLGNLVQSMEKSESDQAMTKKRDRLEIIYDFLNIIRNHDNSIKPTPLLRFSNLSSQRFADYLKEMEMKEFIKVLETKKGRKMITLKDKGFRFLEKYQTIRGFIEDFGL